MVETLTHGFASETPTFVVAALPRLSTCVDYLYDLDTVEIKKTAILTVVWVMADAGATCVNAMRIPVVVSVNTVLEVLDFPGLNFAEEVRQESLDSKYSTIKIHNASVVPAQGWRISCGLVKGKKSCEESRVRLQHDPVYAGSCVGAGVGREVLGWIIDGVPDCLARIVDEVSVDAINGLHHEGCEVNQNLSKMEDKSDDEAHTYWKTQTLTNHLVIRECERVKSQEISVTNVILINSLLHVIRQKRLVDWAAKNGNVVSHILENLDSVVLATIRGIAPANRRVNDSIHSSGVFAFSSVGVTLNAVLQDSSSIIECMTCVA